MSQAAGETRTQETLRRRQRDRGTMAVQAQVDMPNTPLKLSGRSRPLDKTASLVKWLRRPPRERKISGSNPACDGIFPGSSHTSDLKIDAPVVTLPGAWRYRASAGTGWPGVSIL